MKFNDREKIFSGVYSVAEKLNQSLNPIYDLCKGIQLAMNYSPISTICTDMSLGLSKMAENWNSAFSSLSYIENMAGIRASLEGVTDFGKALLPFVETVPPLMAEKMSLHYTELIGIENRINRIFEPIAENHRLASRALLDSVASLRATMETFRLPSRFVSDTLGIANSYQAFAKRQYNAVEKGKSNPNTVIPIVDYSGEMLVRGNTSIGLNCEFYMEGEETPEISFTANRANVFAMLSLHLSHLYKNGYKGKDIFEEIEKSIPAMISKLGCEILELVFRINGYYQATTGHCIFNPSNKMFSAAANLTSFVAFEQKGFADIVDSLYFLLYEGSGCLKRVLEISNDKQLMPIWIIKHLRREFRHDLEQGDGIVKKNKDSREAFFKLIEKPRPLVHIDWKYAQLNLYRLVVEMLNELLLGSECRESPHGA